MWSTASWHVGIFMVKLLGVDCSLNCFDVGGVIAADMEPGALRRRLDDIYLHRRERPGWFDTVSCPWTRVAELGRDAAYVGRDLFSFEHLASPAAECPSWVSFSIRHGPTRCQRRSEDVVAKEAFASQRKVIANSRLVRVWLSFVSLRMRILWSLLSLALPVSVCNEKGVIRAIMIFIRLCTFVILCLQFHCTEKVVPLRSSTASRYRAYLVNSTRFSTRTHVNMWDPRHHGMELFFWSFVLIFVYKIRKNSCIDIAGIILCLYGSFCHACHGGALGMAMVLQHHGTEFRLATQCASWK